MVDYNKRLVEVDEILNYLIEEDLLKIPEDVRKAIKDNKDQEYVWKYDETKSLKEQNISRDTIIILSYLNMEYLLDEKQKEFMKQIYILNEKKLEESKKGKYSTQDLFKINKVYNQEKQEKEETQQSLEKCKENFFSKVIKLIKKLFNKM